jgi:hypothetical protein
MMSRVFGVGLSLALLAITAGCGGNHEVMEKELNELRAEVSRLRAQQASISERIDSMDVDRAKGAPSTLRAPGPPAPAPAPVVAARDGERPQLDVVRLAPSEGDGDVDNDPARPVVRAVGDAGARPTLNNRTIAGHPSKKSVTVVPQKKTDGDAPPAPKQ